MCAICHLRFHSADLCYRKDSSLWPLYSQLQRLGLFASSAEHWDEAQHAARRLPDSMHTFFVDISTNSIHEPQVEKARQPRRMGYYEAKGCFSAVPVDSQ